MNWIRGGGISVGIYGHRRKGEESLEEEDDEWGGGGVFEMGGMDEERECV